MRKVAECAGSDVVPPDRVRRVARREVDSVSFRGENPCELPVDDAKCTATGRFPNRQRLRGCSGGFDDLPKRGASLLRKDRMAYVYDFG